MHSVIDINTTILVTREGNKFVIVNLATGAKIYKKDSEFYGNLFKYEHDFLTSFKNTFTNTKNILLSYEASDYMTDLIAFNRIDN